MREGTRGWADQKIRRETGRSGGFYIFFLNVYCTWNLIKETKNGPKGLIDKGWKWRWGSGRRCSSVVVIDTSCGVVDVCCCKTPSMVKSCLIAYCRRCCCTSQVFPLCVFSSLAHSLRTLIWDRRDSCVILFKPNADASLPDQSKHTLQDKITYCSHEDYSQTLTGGCYGTSLSEDLGLNHRVVYNPSYDPSLFL